MIVKFTDFSKEFDRLAAGQDFRLIIMPSLWCKEKRNLKNPHFVMAVLSFIVLTIIPTLKH